MGHLFNPFSSRRSSEENDFASVAFVDANVIYEAIIDANSKSLDFFTGFRVRTRALVTSTHAIGEVLRNLYKDIAVGEDFQLEKSMESLRKLLSITNITVENLSERTFELVKNIKEEDTRIKFKDAIHVAVAFETGCSTFVTMGTGIGRETLKKFGLRLDTP